MDVLQKELDNTVQLWNSHVIHRRRGGISGIPEELYNIPALYGMIYNNSYYNFSIIIHSTSDYEECRSTFNDQDLDEFLELVNILMNESGWYMPNNCEELLVLFLNLITEIQ